MPRYEYQFGRVVRDRPPALRATKKVFHYREHDQAHFWHWSDQNVVTI